ncbi:MAG: VCBS repeat-containing protein [Bryobacterales bacterium]|nr:VCBS repeat-containing protein [Bryobacterales bacterium]
MRNFIPLAAALAGLAAWSASRPPEIPFTRHMIDGGASETCAVADIDGDGKPDIVSGEFWYQAPDWKPHRFRSLNYENYYIDNFSDLAVDVNGDGHVDIVSCSYFSKRLYWLENPGRGRGVWKEHDIDSGYSVEFAFLVDLNNDGKALEILPQHAPASSPLAWYELRGGRWVKHVVSDKSYGHGIGAGDINGDGRTDILTPQGWFEALPGGQWKWRPEYTFDKGVGFLFVRDVDGDGRNDIVTTHAHDYGFYWLGQQPDGQWTRNAIDESWSQAHAMTMVDLNSDGRMDFVTGKRYHAHNGRDPGGREPLGIYWYESIPSANPKRQLEWVRHTVDYGTRAGGGMQIPVVDLDGDGDLDFVVAGKSGLFLFENRTKGR